MLPIYIGDDLTDEDAFDAIRFDGIGMVVRYDEDGGRPTAAQFTLNDPTEVREFLRRGGNWLAYVQKSSDEAWNFTYEGYDPHDEKLREALCTVGTATSRPGALRPNPRRVRSTTRAPTSRACTTVSTTWSPAPRPRTKAW